MGVRDNMCDSVVRSVQPVMARWMMLLGQDRKSIDLKDGLRYNHVCVHRRLLIKSCLVKMEKVVTNKFI